ncbi:MAG: cytochrome c3 family protein [Phycisphaerales bacterium]
MRRFLRRIGLRGWKRWTITLLVLFALTSVGSVELTSQSFFCNSCHIMEPYYASWKHGAHKNVECVKCHINPGVDNFIAAKLNGLGQVVDDVLHRTSMKPSASVSALSCTRSGCHDLQRVRDVKKDSGDYLFRHDKHLDLEFAGIKVSCTTCHSHIKGDEHFEINTNVCINCHLIESSHDNAPAAAGAGVLPSLLRMNVREDRALAVATSTSPPPAAPPPPPPEHAGKLAPASCTTCHTPPPGTIERNGLKVTHAEYLSYGAKCESCHRGNTTAPVPIENGHCLQCHTFGLEKVLPTPEMHRVHNEGRHKIECSSCHGTMHHGPIAQTGTLEQFDCRKCHIDQHAVQRNTYLHDESPRADGRLPAVSPMFLAHIDCTGCHIKPRPVSVKPTSGAMVFAAVAEACDRCHRPGFGAEMVPLWQRTAHALFDAVESDYNSLDPTAQLDPEVIAVRRLLDMVRADGSWGVHNPRYTQQLLEQARTRLALFRARETEPPK